MDEKPTDPKAIPFVPLNATTLGSNLVAVYFTPGNGGIELQVGEQRSAPVQHLGDQPQSAVFEIGRFMLTPRALRQLLTTAIAAEKAYEKATNSALPTESQFIAQAAVSSLEGLIQPPDTSGGPS